MLKVLSKYGYNCPVKIVINQVKSGRAAQKAYTQLKDTVNKFLSLKVQPLGIMASDKNVRAAVISQTPFFMLFPDTIASKCIKSISNKLIENSGRYGDMPLELFWDKCLAFFDKYHKLEKKPLSAEKSEIKSDKKNKTKELTISSDIQKTLSHIESKLSFLTEEVKEIKKIIKKDKQTPALPEAKAISLDFESWLKKGS